MHERRRAPSDRRRRRRAPFVASVREQVGPKVMLGLAQNLGEDGIGVRRPLGRTFSPDTRITLAFELPDGGKMLRLRGELVWERAEGGYNVDGLRFADLSPVDRERIVRFLNRP
jgi:hypothetical protein